jgi:hypothetical protein
MDWGLDALVNDNWWLLEAGGGRVIGRGLADAWTLLRNCKLYTFTSKWFGIRI